MTAHLPISRKAVRVVAFLIASIGHAEPESAHSFIVNRMANSSIPRKLVWTKEEPEHLDLKAITPMGDTLLRSLGPTWRHASTEHFVLHFEREIFARKVARMGEFFYTYMAQELQGTQEKVDGRSHIFILRSEEKWASFVAQTKGSMEWAAAFVEGNTMYLQKLQDRRASADLLAHEMSHLVLNRYFQHRLPLWLNEGLAEWYEEFAYAAFKGVKKSRRAQFRRIKKHLPLANLIEMTTYPSTPRERDLFYQTSKHLVGFLRLSSSQDHFLSFLKDMIQDPNTQTLIQKHFQVSSIKELEERFLKFTR